MWALNFFLEVNLTNMFFRVAFVTCLLALVSANPIDEVFNPRIVGGSDATQDQFPYMVSVQRFSNKHWCGGAIISENWILTAAHCLSGFNETFMVKAGKLNITAIEPNEQAVPVQQVIIHEKYTKMAKNYDIALLELSHPLKLNTHVNTISLPAQNSQPNGTAILTGWGSYSRTKQPLIPSILQVVYLELLDIKTCYQVFRQLDPSFSPKIYPTNVCTAAGNADLSACNGDSGGPLIIGNEIVGIVSWGAFPCGNGVPTVYTKVSSYIDWISQKMKNN